jgi:protein involved in polysaccharide export with SLBB domain
MNKWILLGIVGMAGLLVGCSETPLPAGPPVAVASSYTLGPGDKLQITTFGFKDLSGEVQVATDGTVSMSLIEPVSVIGMTPADLEQAIAARLLKNNVVRNPRVTCAVMEYRPYRVLGEVRNPGEYKFASGMTVVKAISSAGSYTYRANRRKVFIIRENSNVEEPVMLTASTPLSPGDTVRIGERYL